ncbi:MAG: peptidase E, partial [Actinomycetota bacterium]|nr:peptidase E [Actinomycetota bacterium]
MTGKERPRICFVGTAGAEDAETALELYEGFRARAEVSFLRFFPWPPEDLRAFALGQDAIFVGGGNTANMLAIWRVHGLDRVLREAWEAGVVLCGVSAGMICWFEAGVTDSFGPQLEGLLDGLGFLPGIACPHYDGEERRRPVYTSLVREGFPPGYAAED